MNITSCMEIDLAYWFAVLGMFLLIAPAFPLIGSVNMQSIISRMLALQPHVWETLDSNLGPETQVAFEGGKWGGRPRPRS
jgi:hypothetical protein